MGPQVGLFHVGSATKALSVPAKLVTAAKSWGRCGRVAGGVRTRTFKKGVVTPTRWRVPLRLVCPPSSAALDATAPTSVPEDTLILDPPADDDQLPHAALIWYPGVLVDASQYAAYAKNAQEKLKGKVHLWVVLVNIDWNAVFQVSGSFLNFHPKSTVDAVIPQIEAKGFKPDKEVSGNGTRYLNVVAGGHSAGGFYAEKEVIKSAGGMIISGCGTMNPTGACKALQEFPYPVLISIGELDSQIRWVSQTKAIVDAFQAGLVFGKKMAAAQKNINVIPGMEHMQIASDQPRYEYGGVDGDITMSEAIAACGDLTAAFIDVHFGAGNKQASLSVLEQGLFGPSMQIIKPFLEAAGFADMDLALKQLQEGTGDGETPWKRSKYMSYSEGDVGMTKCALVQKLTLPKSMNMRIIPALVTDENNFWATKPSLQPPVGDEPAVVVPVVYIHQATLGGSPRGAPRTPEYWMKLALSKDVTYSMTATLGEGDANGGMSLQNFGSMRNSEVFEETMKGAAKATLDRYHRRGIPPEFGPDIVFGSTEVSLEQWTSSDDHKIQLKHDASSNVNVIRSPLVHDDEYIMVKMWGPARAFEYFAFLTLQTPPED